MTPMQNKISKLRDSIAYILIKDGEAKVQELSGKLGSEGTSVAVALKAMFEAGEVTRIKVWRGNKQLYVYRHMNRAAAVIGAPPSPTELARYIMLDGRRAAKLSDQMLEQVKQHALDGRGTLRIRGPDPATKEMRAAAYQQKMALPTGQHVTFDIVKYASATETAYGLSAPNARTVEHFLKWYPEYKCS